MMSTILLLFPYQVMDLFGLENGMLGIQGWKESSAIYTGNGGTNILRIHKKGSYCYFYINGTQVHSMLFQSFFGSNIGYVIHYNQKIAVDYLRVSYRKRVEDLVATRDAFYDSFSSNMNNWVTGSTKEATNLIASGTYLLEHFIERRSSK